MKVLMITFSDMTSDLLIPGLENLGAHEVDIFRYDRVGVPVDQPMLNAVELEKPDVCVYFGMAGGPFLARPETFRKIRDVSRTIHISGDLSDPDWHALLGEYARHECFDTTVNLDGNSSWPHSDNDLTLLTPAEPSFYREHSALHQRPIKFGFAGGYSSPSRSKIILRLIEVAGLQVKPREEQAGTYQRYADFMTSVRIVPSVPFSGSDKSTQVKGRVIESGLAGCVLLDHRSSPAKNWFAVGDDFMVYDTADDAADHVKFLLNNPQTMTYLADNLQKKVRERHSPAKFWAQVFEKAMR